MSASSESYFTRQFKDAVDEAYNAESSEERVKKLLKAKKYLQKVSQEMDDDRADEVEDMADSLDEVAKKENGTSPSSERRSGGRNGRQPEEDDSFFEQPPDLTLDDVGGMHELKDLLEHKVIHQFQHTEFRQDLGVSPTNGIMLHGPPGTGKTYISKALAGELGYNYAQIRASDLVSSYVGQTGQNVAELFEKAHSMQPCVIFIDEIDSIASDRQSLERDGQAYSNAVSEMLQGVQDVQGEDILVIAATNLLDRVDGAIRRSDRFDQKIEVPAPDASARKEILDVHLQERETGEKVDTARLAELAENFSAADLKKVVEEAAQTAHIESVKQDELQPVIQRHLHESLEATESSLQRWTS